MTEAAHTEIKELRRVVEEQKFELANVKLERDYWKLKFEGKWPIVSKSPTTEIATDSLGIMAVYDIARTLPPVTCPPLDSDVNEEDA